MGSLSLSSGPPSHSPDHLPGHPGPGLELDARETQQSFDKQRFEELLIKLSVKKDEYLTKKINLEKLNYKNTWNNVNQKLLEIFNEN